MYICFILIRIRLIEYHHELFSYYLNSCFGQTWISKSVSQQVGQANINGTKLKALNIPLPPINEQRRIVAKIEALTARSRKAREALDAIPALLEQFRQSVLAAAFRGDLTADWREQNPDVEWQQTTLNKVIKEKPRNGYSPRAVDYPTKVKSSASQFCETHFEN